MRGLGRHADRRIVGGVAERGEREAHLGGALVAPRRHGERLRVQLVEEPAERHRAGPVAHRHVLHRHLERGRLVGLRLALGDVARAAHVALDELLQLRVDLARDEDAAGLLGELAEHRLQLGAAADREDVVGPGDDDGADAVQLEHRAPHELGEDGGAAAHADGRARAQQPRGAARGGERDEGRAILAEDATRRAGDGKRALGVAGDDEHRGPRSRGLGARGDHRALRHLLALHGACGARRVRPARRALRALERRREEAPDQGPVVRQGVDGVLAAGHRSRRAGGRLRGCIRARALVLFHDVLSLSMRLSGRRPPRDGSAWRR